MQRTRWREPDVLVVAIGLVVGVLAALLATSFSVGTAVDVAVHPIAMAVMLIAVCLPMIRWAVDGEQMLFRIVLGGLAAKIGGTFLRFTLTGNGDNAAYHQAATNIAGWLSESIVGPSGIPSQFGGDGSGRLAYGLGWLYYITGADRLTGFVMFTFISFVGTLFFFRAAITAVPELDKKRYALLLFFMPSMLFWPSTIGKEAWMIGFVGLAALGISAVVSHRLSLHYLVFLGIGLVMAGQVRPHIAALVLVALVAATAWPTKVAGSRARQVVIVVVAFGLLSVAMGEVAEFFDAEEGELTDILDFAQGRTDEGGSAFAPVRVTGPQNLVQGTISVLFRPFPIEADNLFQLLGALESAALIVLSAFSLRRIRRLPRVFLDNGYLRFAVIYTMGFVVAFSVISNFGILTRQRAQLWPMFLILLALSPKSDTVEPEGTADQRITSTLDTGSVPKSSR